MSGKHLLKLFSYANGNFNRILNFSVNPLLQRQCRILPFVRSTATEFSKPNIVKDSFSEKNESLSAYYWRYFLNDDYYNSFFNVKNIDSITESDFTSIKLIADLAKNIQIFTEIDIKLSHEASECLEKEISNFEVNDFRKVLALINKCKSFIPEINNNFKSMYKCIDVELCKRNFSTSEILSILCILNMTQRELWQKSFYFPQRASIKLLNKINSLSSQEIALFFFCAPQKNLKKLNSKFLLHSYLCKNLSVLNSDELGIVAFGLQKLNLTFNHSEIFNIFIEKTLEEIENINSVPFKNVCKTLQAFSNKKDVKKSLEFQERLVPYAPRLNFESLIEAALINYKYRALNLLFKDSVVEKFKDSFKSLTLIGIMRMLHLTVLCNIQDKDLLLLIHEGLEDINLNKNNKKAEENITFLLKNLTHHKFYPKKLLDEVLTVEFFNLLNNDNFSSLGKVSWWSLYWNVKLEKPEYCEKKINFSSLKSFYKMNKYLLFYNKNQNEEKFHISELHKIRAILTRLYGEKNVFQTNALPHYEPGIILKFNKKMEAQILMEGLNFGHEYFAKKPLQDNNFWIFILPLEFHDFLWQSNVPILRRQTQLRQLKILGYVPVVVKYSDLMEKTQSDQEQFLRNLIVQTLESLTEMNKSN